MKPPPRPAPKDASSRETNRAKPSRLLRRSIALVLGLLVLGWLLFSGRQAGGRVDPPQSPGTPTETKVGSAPAAAGPDIAGKRSERFTHSYPRLVTELRVDRVPLLTQAPAQTTSRLDRDVPAVMMEFARWLAKVSDAAPAARDTLWAEGRALLEERLVLWEDWARRDPEAAILLSPTPAHRSLLPSDITDRLERIVSGVGFYGVRMACSHSSDAPHEQRCEMGHDVIIGEGTLSASIYGSRVERMSEENASIYGVALGRTLALHADDVALRPLDPRSEYPLELVYRGESHRVTAPADLNATLVRLFTP